MIDKDQALSLLRQVVQEKGPSTNQYHDQGGYYFELSDDDFFEAVKTAPRCIVGHVAVASGDDDFVDALAADNDARLPNIARHGNLPLADDAVVVLNNAQIVQDGHGYVDGDDKLGGHYTTFNDTSWGAALAYAEERARA